jgi:hypothetical protein
VRKASKYVHGKLLGGDYLLGGKTYYFELVHVPRNMQRAFRGIYLARTRMINDNAKKSKITALVRLDQLESVESASAIMFMHGQLGAATT